MSSLLVSIITPWTPNRIDFMKRLANCVTSQSYKNHEWLTDSEPGTIGEKRNRLCEKAKGEIIVHFDSDDWYGPEYIASCVAHILTTGGDVTGIKDAYFLDEEKQRAWLYEYKGSQPYVIGSGMMYRRSVWERNHFKAINEGEDMHFLTNAGKIKPHGNVLSMFARIHGDNTASHNAVNVFKPVPYQDARGLFTLYR